VARDEQAARDLARVEALDEQRDELALARAEAVRAREQREDLVGRGRPEGDRDRAGAAVDAAGLDDRPAAVGRGCGRAWRGC
jgi:hypothetical protein